MSRFDDFQQLSEPADPYIQRAPTTPDDLLAEIGLGGSARREALHSPAPFDPRRSDEKFE